MQWIVYPYGYSKRGQEQDLETAAMAPNLKLVRIIDGDNKLMSMMKGRLPSATVTE